MNDLDERSISSFYTSNVMVVMRWEYTTQNKILSLVLDVLTYHPLLPLWELNNVSLFGSHIYLLTMKDINFLTLHLNTKLHVISFYIHTVSGQNLFLTVTVFCLELSLIHLKKGSQHL